MLLAVQAEVKEKHGILQPMSYVSNNIKLNKLDKNKYKPNFVPAGQTTQLIIGATPESDLKF